MNAAVRVDADELLRIRQEIAKRGRRYNSSNLDGAIIDSDYALDEAGFVDTEIRRTGLDDRMVVCACRPGWHPVGIDELVERLETTWSRQGAFKHEAHTISRDADGISLEFVTWWDNSAFYTGRIDVKPSLG